MITAARQKSRYIQQYQVLTEGRDVLQATLMLPKPPNSPKRLVFIAPLVGASASQSLIVFRNLTRRGSILMSFEYQGHPRSSGTFELDKTIVDTRFALDWATRYARAHGLPVHGFATCFGTVPLLAQFAKGRRAQPLWSLSTVSGLLGLDQILRFEDFSPILSRHTGVQLDARALLERIARHEVDVNGAIFRDALQEYLQGRFPELRVGSDYFEELSYDRTNIAQTLLQYSQARYLENLAIPSTIPCRFYVGRDDHLLGLHTWEGRQAYRNTVLSLVPHAEVRELDFDHYGRGPDHERTIESLADMFEASEQDTAPFDGSREAVSLQGVLR